MKQDPHDIIRIVVSQQTNEKLYSSNIDPPSQIRVKFGDSTALQYG
jgi:ribosomal protein L31E